MNFRQIEIFVAVMEAGSVTEAAASLGLSQPAVSKSLKSMEESLRVRLFHRNPRGIQPTDEGRALYLEGRRMIESFVNLSAYARALPRLTHARLEISCIPALSLVWLPDAVSGFLASYPDASLTFHTRSSPQTMQIVAQGEADVGISQVWSDDPGLRKTHLIDLTTLCVVPREHRLAGRTAIRLEDLDGETLVLVGKGDALRRAFEAAMHVNSLRFECRVEVGVGAMLLRMVDATGSIGLLDNQSARLHRSARSVLVPLEPRLSVPIYLLESAHRPQSLFAFKFIEHIKSYAGSSSS